MASPKKYPVKPTAVGKEQVFISGPPPEPVPPTPTDTGPLQVLDAHHEHTHSLTVAVKVFNAASRTWDPFEEATVTLTQGGQKVKETNQLTWSDLKKGKYLLKVEPLEAEAEKPNLQSEALEVEIDDEDREVTVELFEKPAVYVRTFEATKAGHRKERRRDINGVACELYRGNERLDCYETGKGEAAGKARLVKVDHSGDYTLEVTPILRIKGTGETDTIRTLQSGLQGRLHFSVDPGEILELEIPYTAASGEVQVNAVLRYGPEDDEQEADMSGVVLALYQDGRALQTLTTTGTAPAVFSGLADERYTLRVVRTPEIDGHPVEPVDPPGGVFTFQLGAGQTLKRDLTFRLAYGTVLSQVYAAGLQEGLEGISLVLIDSDNVVNPVTTGPYGEIRIDVAPGTYTLQLAQDKVTSSDGQRWELAPESPAQRTVVVRAGQPSATAPFVLVHEEHILDVDVLGADGQPVAFAQVTVRDEKGNRIGNRFATDANGHVTIHLDREGIYQVGLDVDATGNPRLAPQIVSVHSRANAILRLRGAASAAPAQPAGPSQTIVDIPYPLLAETAMAPSWPTGGTAPALPDPGRIVQSTLNEVLGWKSRPYKVDGRGFVAALNQAFTVKEVQGHTEFAWIPRSYAVVQDMGALTGAQASIYNRARVALDQALPLLDGLYPLRPDADEQDVEAIRAIVRTGFTELVGELSLEGGPRVPRVDALFESLLGTNGTVDPEQVQGQLGELADRFGLVRSRVNTIEEEQNLTNFLIAVDYVIALRQSWEVQRPFFNRGSGAQPYFGTQLVLVSRALAVVSESVQEACLAMDSVFLGPAERQVVKLTYPNQPPLYVAELLSWVDDAATDEGPRLIQEGGKQGVVAFQPTLTRLARLVRGALVPPQNPNALPAGYSTARVQRALQELADHLEEAAQLAGQLSRRTEEPQLYYSASRESPQRLLSSPEGTAERPGVASSQAPANPASSASSPAPATPGGPPPSKPAGTLVKPFEDIEPEVIPGHWSFRRPLDPQRIVETHPSGAVRTEATRPTDLFNRRSIRSTARRFPTL